MAEQHDSGIGRSSRRDCGALYCHREGALPLSVVAARLPRRSQLTGIADDLAHLGTPLLITASWGNRVAARASDHLLAVDAVLT